MGGHRSRRRVVSCVIFAIAVAVVGCWGAGRAHAERGLSSVRAQWLFESDENPIYFPTSGERMGTAVAVGDFNGDGVDDLAIGIPFDRSLLAADAVGQVQIRYGALASGLPGGVFVDYLWQGGSASVDPPELFDKFGCALAAGDFDGDGFDDLAVGICEEDVGAVTDAGAVEIRYGGPAGLTHDGPRQFFHQDVSGVAETAEAFDRFGSALAASDFDDDGFDDLAIGVPGEGVFFPPGEQADNGYVHVLYGTAAGISTAGAETFDASETGNDAGAGFLFGWALVAADFNGDSHADLAVGSPGRGGAGAVFVYDGEPGGVDPIPAVLITQDSPNVGDTAEPGDGFGRALAAGRFSGDIYADLVVGAPEEDVGAEGSETVEAGAVHLFFGSESGAVTAGSQLWLPSGSGLPDEADVSERFGAAVAAGDFDADGLDELVIGSPGEPLFAAVGLGVVHVLRGTALGPTSTGASIWGYGSPGVPGDALPDDFLGAALTTGDFDGDGHSDLVAGAPRDDVELPDAGSVLVLYGALFADGFESGGDEAWSAVVP